MHKKPLIQLQNIQKKFGKKLVLNEIDLEIFEGEVVCIVGPSGVGKTTLLKCVDLLEIIDQGKMYMDGKLIIDASLPRQKTKRIMCNISEYRANIGFVFQNFNLWPHRRALENVIEGLLFVKKLPNKEAIDIGLAALEKVGMADKAERYPHSLSGGETQRVAIARAVAMQPQVLLLDEITSALDPELVWEVLQVLEQLASEGRTMIIVSHVMQFARRVANQIVFMDQGRILEQKQPDEFFEAPSHSRTREFLAKVLRD